MTLDAAMILERLQAAARELAQEAPSGWRIRVRATYFEPGRRKRSLEFETETLRLNLAGAQRKEGEA